jgi:hypothetical protein
VKDRQAEAWESLCAEYRTINTGNVHPVEQFPYCDTLAREMGIMPTLTAVRSLGTWLKIMIIPASTTHYVDHYFDRRSIERQKVFTPYLILALLSLLRLFEYPLQFIHRARRL